jgi:hypothetical protein
LGLAVSPKEKLYDFEPQEVKGENHKKIPAGRVWNGRGGANLMEIRGKRFFPEGR